MTFTSLSILAFFVCRHYVSKWGHVASPALLYVKSDSCVCHAVRRRNQLHFKSSLGRSRVLYRTIAKPWTLRDVMHSAWSFVWKYKLLQKDKKFVNWTTRLQNLTQRTCWIMIGQSTWQTASDSSLVMTLTLNVDDRQTSAKLNRAETNVKVKSKY